MNIVQDGSNKERKLRSRVIAIIVVIVLLALGIIYTLSKLGEDEEIPTNYIRSYPYTEESESVKNMMQELNKDYEIVQYSIDHTYKKATLVIDKYEGNDLVSSSESIVLEKVNGDGLISAAFDRYSVEFDLKISDSRNTMGIGAANITEKKNFDINGYEWSMQMIGEEPIEITKGEAIPLFVVYLSSKGRTSSYLPDAVEDLASKGQLNMDYTTVVKVIFD